MNFSREELLEQTQKDREYFSAMSINVQNALRSEVAEVWPRVKAPLGDADDATEAGPLFEIKPITEAEAEGVVETMKPVS